MKKRFLIEENINPIINTALSYALNAIENGEEGEYKLEEIAVIFTEEKFNTIAYLKDLNNIEIENIIIKDIKDNCFNQFYDKLLNKLSNDYNVITIKY